MILRRCLYTLSLAAVFACGTAGLDGDEAAPDAGGPASQPAGPQINPFALNCPPGAPPLTDAEPARLLDLIASYRTDPCALSTSYGPLTAEAVAFYSASASIPEGIALAQGQTVAPHTLALEPGRYTVLAAAYPLLDQPRGDGASIHLSTLDAPPSITLTAPLRPMQRVGRPGGTLIMPDATSTLRRFSYVTGDPLLADPAGPALAGMSGADFYSSRIESTLRTLNAEGVTLVVSLTLNPPQSDWFDHYQIAHLKLGVQDFTAPTVEQLETFVAAFAAQGARGRTVVHCGAGLGRTGTFLAAYFVSRGYSADDAIAHVRNLRPGSIETQTQEAIIETFAQTHGALAGDE